MGCRPLDTQHGTGPEREEGWHFFGVFPWSKGRKGRTSWFAKVMHVLLFPAALVVVSIEIAHLVAGWTASLWVVLPAAAVVVAYLGWIARESVAETRLLLNYHRKASNLPDAP